MDIYYSLILLAFLAGMGIVLIRYVNTTVDKEFRNLARAVDDDEFRSGELSRVDALLASQLPLPADVRPLSGPLSSGRSIVPPVLMAVGVILLWGAGSAVREERPLWFYGALACLVLASGIMLITLRKRKWERTARLLRFRADLKRMDGERAGAAADLRELIKLTPWDDAAWAELAEDLNAECRVDDALDAIGQAARLDPRYDEYRMIEASLAIRAGKLDQARGAVDMWVQTSGMDKDDPRPVVYRAAIQLAAGNRDSAAASLRNILLDSPDGPGFEFLDTDQALAGVKDLLPGSTAEDACERN